MGLRETLNLVPEARSVHRIALCAALLAAAPAVATARPGDGCSVWVVRNALSSREDWERALAAVERTGCGTMYLQVSGRWDAYFPSAVFVPPASPPVGEGWADDPFGHALAEAHDHGIRVEAWIDALLAWSAPDPPADPEHVYLRHPDWFVVGPDGRSMRALDRADLDRAGLVGEGWFLDPGREAVRTELRRFVLEVATRYAVDGIHLDYIRYPAGWTPPGGPERVTRLVGLIRGDLRAVRPGLVLSAAVLPRPDEARRSFGQDWADWLARGLVDRVAPMVYRDSPGAVLATVRAWPGDLPLGRVVVGVRIDRLAPAEVRETARRLDALGAAGVALFSQNFLLERRDWERAGPIGGR